MKKLIFVNAFIVFLLFCSNLSYSQFDTLGQGCGTHDESENIASLQNIPVKTENANEYLRVLVIYVTFRNDNSPNYDYTIWDPPNFPTATRPENPYSGTNGHLIDSLVGDSATYFMNRYSQFTISDYFCQMSMGTYDVIGDEYYFVTPQNEGFYDTLGFNRGDMNEYVLEYLDTTQTIDWSRYDNWEFTGGNWVFDEGNGDGDAEMVIICYRNLPDNYNSSSNHYQWFWPSSYGGEASLGFSSTLTFDGIDVGPDNGVTAINFRHNTTHSEIIMIHEYSHKIFGNNIPLSGAHISNGLMTPAHDNSTYTMSPFERSASVVEYITPTVVSPGGGDQTFTLRDFIEYGDVLKIPIAGTSDYIWVSNHQKNSIYDGTLRGGKTCYSTNFSEQDPYCGEGNGIVIERQGSGCGNINEPYDIVSAEGKFDWAVDRVVFVPTQNYHHSLGFNMSIPEEVFPGDEDTRYFGKDEYKKTVLSGVGTIVMNELCPDGYYIGWENRGEQRDAFNMDYDEIFSPYSNPSSKFCNDEDDPAVTIALLQNDHGEIDVKVYFDDENALDDLPPSKPKNVKTSKDYISAGYFNPKITWDPNIEPDFKTLSEPAGVYKLLRGVTTDCESEPGSYNLIATLDYDVTEFVDENVYLYDDSAGSGICSYNYRSYHYKLIAVDVNSDESLPSDKDIISGWLDPCAPETRPGLGSEIPKTYDLKQNYPNPFNPTTNIQFDLPKDGLVSLKIYDMLGREVASLVNDFRVAGSYIVSFNGSNFASGIYYYKIKAGTFESTRRMVLIK